MILCFLLVWLVVLWCSVCRNLGYVKGVLVVLLSFCGVLFVGIGGSLWCLLILVVLWCVVSLVYNGAFLVLL